MAEKQTTLQQLSDLVEWFLGDRMVELKFVPNALCNGKYAPEFDFHYWMDGRRIAEKTLAFMIMTEMLRRNYAFNLSRITASLVEHSWRYYVADCDYPDHLKNDLTPLIRRPVGRPRLKPKTIPFNEVPRKPRKNKKTLNTGSQDLQNDHSII